MTKQWPKIKITFSGEMTIQSINCRWSKSEKICWTEYCRSEFSHNFKMGHVQILTWPIYHSLYSSNFKFKIEKWLYPWQKERRWIFLRWTRFKLDKLFVTKYCQHLARDITSSRQAQQDVSKHNTRGGADIVFRSQFSISDSPINLYINDASNFTL